MKDFVPTFFKDFGKAVNDVLKPSKYDLGRQLEVKTISKNKTKFTVSSNLLEDGASGQFSAKRSCGEHGVMEAELGVDGRITAKFTPKPFVDGLKLVVSEVSHPAKKSFVTAVDASYSRNGVAFSSIAINKGQLSDYSYVGSLAVGAAGVSIGGQLEANNGTIKNYSVGAQYSDEDFVLTVTSLAKCDKIEATYSHQINSNALIVASLGYNLSKAKAGVQNMRVGGTYKIDSASSTSAVYSTDGHLSAMYETTVRPNVKLSLGTIVNIDNLSRQTIGAKITLGD